MPRLLLNKVSREMLAPFLGKKMIVTLHPGDMIGFRKKRSRLEYVISLHRCIPPAVAEYIKSDYKERLEEAKAARRAGVKGVRMPKKPTLSVFDRKMMKLFDYKPPKK